MRLSDSSFKGRTALITLIIDTPSGLPIEEPEDIVGKLEAGQYKPDGKGGWKLIRRDKVKGEDHDFPGNSSEDLAGIPRNKHG